ncbi:predicted protein [Naegleria gruberi]|uniref:Predicted protein n=1 Tax=Naegleria gruberi TaxID=5762 RepID=D2VK19_NAEGR|nr:uncharacterized protein NAEGRDRAFT_50191 [Naegleria gruberi]EFC42873.1 predicted protein [Naegleria gruberi]|eukprot:XP_002675617.1 predicted protein [Naegleria gruberi strain NEG-M]
MSIFDIVICHHVMEYLDFYEWPTVRPYLISKTFKEVFNSEKFAKFFLIRNLRLSEKEFNSLEEIVKDLYYINESEIEEQEEVKNSHVEDEFDSLEEDGENDTDESSDEVEHYLLPPRYKEKHFAILERIPKTVNEIMIMFAILSMYYGVEGAKHSISEGLKYERGMEPDLNFKNWLRLLMKFEVDNILHKEFNNYLKSGCQFLSEKLRELVPNSIPIDGKVTKFLEGSIKDFFILEGDTLDRNGEMCTTLKIIIFTSSGFPLTIESSYKHDYETNDPVETFSCFDGITTISNSIDDFKKVNCISNYGSFEALQSLLMDDENCDEYLMELGCKKEHLESFKNLTIYGFLQCSFGTNKFKFMQNSDERFLPFF